MTLGASAERIRNFRLNWLDGLMTARIRVVKRQAEATHRANALAMIQRAYRRIVEGPLGEAFFNWKLNHHSTAMRREASGAMSQSLARVVREGGIFMLRSTLYHWTQSTVGRIVHVWRARAWQATRELEHAQQVMYLAEVNEGLAHDKDSLASQLEAKGERLTKLERFAAFFDEHAPVDTPAT